MVRGKHLVLFCLFPASLGWSANHTITQKGKAFSVQEITVAVGDSVVFKNDDDTAHNVFSSSAGYEFNVGIQKAGAESSQKFDKAGIVEARCAIHPQMKLKVNVK